jgi:hypothetical protein
VNTGLRIIFKTLCFLCNLQMGSIRLSVTNILAYWAHLKVTKKTKHCEYGLWIGKKKFCFLCNLQMGSIRLSVTNILAYWTHLKVTPKTKNCEYRPCDSIHDTLFSLQLTNGLNTLKCDKHSSLLGSFES